MGNLPNMNLPSNQQQIWGYHLISNFDCNKLPSTLMLVSTSSRGKLKILIKFYSVHKVYTCPEIILLMDSCVLNCSGFPVPLAQQI